MAYLRCPECRLTARASASFTYFVQGDRCPRCLTPMEPADSFRDAPGQAAAKLAAAGETSRIAPGRDPRPA
jgi:hypothetical protein